MLLIGAGTLGAVLSIERDDWRMLIASVGVLVIAFIYILAARRGKPL